MNLSLRRATIEDARDVLRWRNDPATRENSFNKAEIDLNSHLAWFERKLNQKECLMFIMMDDGQKVGNIRLDVTDGVGEISYMIAPEYRGKGYGKKMLILLEAELNEIGADVKTLTAFVLKDNIASMRCFLDNGYTGEDAGDSFCYSKML